MNDRIAGATGASAQSGAGRSQREVIHKVNAYTWAGRRAECALTSEFLPSVQGWEGVTCVDCLAVKATDDASGQTSAKGTS